MRREEIRGRKGDLREVHDREGRVGLWNQQGNQNCDVGLNTIKVRLRKFKGESDPDEFLAWESTCERIFQFNDLNKEKKSCYTIAHFEGYATT